MAARGPTVQRLVNGSTGDPVLYLDYPGADNALLFDGGDNCSLSLAELGDLAAAFITHHHVDHFIGLDRLIRANIDRDKVLHLFGPAGTIRKVYDRVRAYEYPYFPFQKIVVQVTELEAGVRRTARLECTRRFPKPEIVEEPWDGPVCYETPRLQVEAVPVDHTVPCLAFALVEKPGYHPDPARLAAGPLRPGRWITEVLNRLHAGADPAEELEVGGGRFPLGQLAERYFSRGGGGRIAYVTDTLWSEAVRPELVRLARGARRLYCDSYYAAAHAASAARHKHLTAPQAAELARLARVERLVLMHFSPRYAGRYHRLVEEAAAVFPDVTADLPPGAGL